MKLAEALQERADLNRRIEQLRYRLGNNALMQEGEKPAEDPAALLRELEECLSRLEWLISRINLTNCAVKVDGHTLTELIARRDILSQRAEAYRRLVEEASQNTHRATRTEIKILPAVDVPALQSWPMTPPATSACWITPCRPPTGPPTCWNKALFPRHLAGPPSV